MKPRSSRTTLSDQRRTRGSLVREEPQPSVPLTRESFMDRLRDPRFADALLSRDKYPRQCRRPIPPSASTETEYAPLNRKRARPNENA
jgi:hypothetical protein